MRQSNQKELKRKRENETKSQNIISHFCTPIQIITFFLIGGGGERRKEKNKNVLIDFLFIFFFLSTFSLFLRFPLL